MAKQSTLDQKMDRAAFNLRRRGAFYADMAAFMDSDIPPFQAIEKMESIVRRRRSTARVARVYRMILRDLKSGKPLASSLAPWVPGNEAVMLVGAEKAGPAVLVMAFRELSTLLDRQQKARAKLRAALLSNGLVFAVILGVIFEVVKIMVPELVRSETKDMASRMTFAPYFFAFGQGVIHYGAFVAIAIVLLCAVVWWSLPNWTRHFSFLSRRWLDNHIVPWTVYKRSQATFFLSTTAAMMRSGIPLKVIASDMLPFASKWMRLHLRRVLGDLEAGRSEVDALGGGMLPLDTSDRLRIYALMKDFTAIMTRLSEDNFVIYEKTIDGISALMKTLSILVLGLFAASLLFAIFDYSNALQASVNAMRSAAGG